MFDLVAFFTLPSSPCFSLRARFCKFQADLKKVDRSRTPWLIVVLHAPWYNTNHAHQHNGDAMKKALEQVLYEAHVDILVAGHVHAYERTVSMLALEFFLSCVTSIVNVGWHMHRCLC